jgi:hypothetical protein
VAGENYAEELRTCRRQQVVIVAGDKEGGPRVAEMKSIYNIVVT